METLLCFCIGVMVGWQIKSIRAWHRGTIAKREALQSKADYLQRVRESGL